MKHLIVIAVVVTSIFFVFNLSAQEFSVKVTKERVQQDFDGHGLKVVLNKDYKSDTIYPRDYDKAYSFAFRLDKHEKLKLLEEMMVYFVDYSLCGYRVKMYSPFARIFGVQKITNRKYSIAIEAMYLINLMFYGEYTRYLSNFQVLMNKCDNEEIAYNDSLNITKMTNLYKSWYSNVKNNIEVTNFSLLDLLDLYKGPICWVDMENMPPVKEIASVLINQENLIEKNTRNKQDKNIFKVNRPKGNLPKIKPKFKVRE